MSKRSNLPHVFDLHCTFVNILISLESKSSGPRPIYTSTALCLPLLRHLIYYSNDRVWHNHILLLAFIRVQRWIHPSRCRPHHECENPNISRDLAERLIRRCLLIAGQHPTAKCLYNIFQHDTKSLCAKEAN